MQLRATHPLAVEFGPASPSTREAIAQLVADTPSPEWSEVYGGVTDPRGELQATYGIAAPPEALLHAVHAYFALVARQVAGETVAAFDLCERVPGIALEPGADVLRDLYQQLLPGRLRGALGEFLTPRWLAEACLRRLEETGAPLATGRVLDPTCGTGTFLLPVLARRLDALRASGTVTRERVQAVLDSIAGYDVNPVAVLAARANVVVALGELAAVGDLTLPLHRADATRDAPAGAFDVVVGNPPWIGWRKLSERRRRAGMADWERLGLWRAPAEAGARPAKPPMGDLATLVYATAVARHAAPGGFVGMLVPNALVIGDPGGRAFRRFELGGRRFAPAHVDLWDAVDPFAPDASNQPVFLISRADGEPCFPVPAARWSRVNGRLRETRGGCWPVARDVPTSPWSFVADGADLLAGGANHWRFGVGFHTRGANGVYFVDVLSSASGGLVEIANIPRAGRDPAVERRRGRVEAALVYPALRGRDVARWRAEPAGHVFAPYRQEAMGTPPPDFAAAFPHGHRWLSAFRAQLERRRLVATLRWDLEGEDWPRIMGTEHMTGAPCVVVREFGRRPAAAVVLPREDERLGRRATVLIDHKLLYCALATEDEAHYLAAMINATPIQDLLASFSNVVGVAPGTLARLPIPPHDAPEAAALVAAAKDAAAGVEDAERRVDAEAQRLLKL